MKKLNLIGKKYGLLTVLMEGEPHTKPSGTKITTWVCLCDCGNTVTVRTEYLRSGHTQSCGCLCGRTDITGKRFGKLVVVEYVDNSSYLCKCDCGNVVTVKTCNLKNGNTLSCGCYQKQRISEATFKSLVGQRFGKLVVVERVANNRFGHVCYRCKCDCGGGTIVDSTNLKNGNTTSCGCIKSKGEMKINQWLTNHKINFIPQYSHNDIFLSSGRRPFFDFAIFDNSDNLLCLIEYQGPQHYGYSGYGWDNEENFKQTVRRDDERRDGCKRLNIPLYEIPYWDFDNTDKILEMIIAKEVKEQ
jgi:hypothetical protein